MTSFSKILGQSWKVKLRKVKLLKFKTFNFDLKFYWNWSFFHYEKIMRFKKSPQLPGAGRTRAWHHHESHTPISPGSILLCKYLANVTLNIFAASVLLVTLRYTNEILLSDCYSNTIFYVHIHILVLFKVNSLHHQIHSLHCWFHRCKIHFQSVPGFDMSLQVHK